MKSWAGQQRGLARLAATTVIAHCALAAFGVPIASAQWAATNLHPFEAPRSQATCTNGSQQVVQIESKGEIRGVKITMKKT